MMMDVGRGPTSTTFPPPMPLCPGLSGSFMAWDAERLTGPDGDDWRVPVSELEERRNRLASALAEAGLESALIDDPVELYWLTGGRLIGRILVGAVGSGVSIVHWVRSLLIGLVSSLVAMMLLTRLWLNLV